MSTYKFTGKKTQGKATEVSWATANDKVGAYLPPGQRKQTVEEAFPELKSGLVSLKRSVAVPCESKPMSFADKLKATVDAEKMSISVGNTLIDDDDMFVMPSRKTVVLSDREVWKSRRLYPSSEEEDEKQAQLEEPEDDYDSFDDMSDGENDNTEVYDPSEYDRH
jgi:hypothetical protein